MRSDQWELILDCKGNEDEIPEGFILPKRSPENEDINVKIFVRGREPKQRKENLNVDKTFTGLPSVKMSNEKPPTALPHPPRHAAAHQPSRRSAAHAHAVRSHSM